jgi:hypothetical protein
MKIFLPFFGHFFGNGDYSSNRQFFSCSQRVFHQLPCLRWGSRDLLLNTAGNAKLTSQVKNSLKKNPIQLKIVKKKIIFFLDIT